MVYKFFDKNSARSGVNTYAKNQNLAKELHKPINKGFLKRTVYSGFKDNTWGADLVICN